MALHARHTYLIGAIEYSDFLTPVVVTQAPITGIYMSYPASPGRNTLLSISSTEPSRPEYEPPRSEYEFPRLEYELLRSEYEFPKLEYESPKSEYEFPKLEYELLRSEYEFQKLEYELPKSEYEFQKLEYEPPVSYPWQAFAMGTFSVCYFIPSIEFSFSLPSLSLIKSWWVAFSSLSSTIRLQSPESIYKYVNKSIGVPGTLNITTNTKNLLL